uniref:Uncharacterized protein n=1 Tax=Quercus lobata TaxID=97700 RepID=A0A7N2KVM8_QUELO
MRQSELWSRERYRFFCRAVVSDVVLRPPTTNVDHTLQYLSFGDPKLCCEKLENLLTQGLLYKQLEGTQGREHMKSAASDLLGLYSEMDEHLLEALDLSRTSAAYSLLLAGKLKMQILRIYLVSSLIVSLSLHKSLRDVQPHLCSTAEGHGFNLLGRMNIFQLGVHCLQYGGHFHHLRLCFHRSGKTYPFLTQSSNDQTCIVMDDHTKTNLLAPGEDRRIIVHFVLALLRNCPSHHLLSLSFLPAPYLICCLELL